jgi:ribosome-associated toxin RatA of RatAB toxin-antitoxin module
MKELHGTASTPLSASAEQAFTLLCDLEAYPRWYPETVRSAEVTERSPEGLPAQARAQLHVSYGPLVRDFNLLLAVTADRPSLVALSRIPHDADDPEEFRVTWRIDDSSISIDLDANLSVPRLLPVGGIGESIAYGFVNAAARALSRNR